LKYLIDTNIFLEILLQQEKSNSCKKFLNNDIGSFKKKSSNLSIS